MTATVAITGSSGLIGSALTRALHARGAAVKPVVRHEARNANEISWNPTARLIDDKRLADVDIVINLAGEPIGKRWTGSRRRAIRESRVRGTETIAAAIARAGRRATLINASAIGYYGSRGDEKLSEKSANGRGYLAEVCRDWEAATAAAASAGSRVVIIRNGVVLSSEGGALPDMLKPFKIGAGGKIADGTQWLGWIDIDDMVNAILWLIDHPEIKGVVNLTAPNPVTNAEFTRVASDVLGMPAIIPVPAFALKLIFGEMADQTLLASQRVTPAVLLGAGFEFKRPDIRDSLAVHATKA